MKYKVIWHDREDDRTGEPIVVEAASPVEAHHVATERLSRIPMFNPIDIECLVDEEGKHLHPDFYLADPTGTTR